MANFLIESGPAVAQTMAEADSIAGATRRKNAAYNALRQTYGDAAGDPEAQAQLQANALNTQLDPLKVQQGQIDTTTKQQTYDKTQALQAISTVKGLMDGGMSGADALALVQEHAPDLGLDDAHVKALGPLLDQNHDNVLGHLYDSLSGSLGSKPVGQQVMLRGDDGKVHVGYLGQDGKMHVPTVPQGLAVLPKVTGAGVVVDNGDGTQSVVKTDATGQAVAAALPGKTVQSEQTAQRIQLEAAKVKLMASREARLKSTSGTGPLSPQTVQYLADQYRTSGKLPPMGNGGAALRAQIYNKAANDAVAQGSSGQADVYAAQATHERATAVNDLGKTTPNSAGGKVSAANALVAHLDQLGDLGGALANGNIQAVNSAKQAYMRQTGSAAPTNFDTVKKIAADEATKFIVANGGTGADRKQMENLFSSASSPQQLSGAIQQAQHLAAGQLAGQRQRFDAIGATKEFDSTLTPRTKQILGVTPAAPAGGAGGWSVVGVK